MNSRNITTAATGPDETLSGIISILPKTHELRYNFREFKWKKIKYFMCIDQNPNEDNINRWFTRECHTINLSNRISTSGLDAGNLVFVVQMPLHQSDFSRWHQNLVGVLQIDMVYQNEHKLLDPTIELTLDSRLAFSNRKPDGSRTPWEYYTHAEEKRFMECTFDDELIKGTEKNGYPYNCTMVPLFELGALYHDYYLLNLRLPYNLTANKNTGLAKIDDIYLHIIHMNVGFTVIWMSLKTIFCPLIVGIMIAEGQNKWDETMEIELSSALHTGVYGMWNIYICAMLMLYAPSHKCWPTDSNCGNGEEFEFCRLRSDPNPNEISSLTSFATKTSVE
ncbi:hypothetical protein JTB14_035282 [Gonioctena quinquepunctata]|nr:hypothetical protein JTB14_035282 [Gonioctena quinquepunctata]